MCFLRSCLFRNVVKLNFVVCSAVDFNTCVVFCSYHQKQDMRVPSPNAPLLPVCRHGGPPTPGRLRSVLSPRLAALRASHKWAQTAFIF